MTLVPVMHRLPARALLPLAATGLLACLTLASVNPDTVPTDRPADHLLFDFDADTDPAAWRVVDDGVMGGRSRGHFAVTEEGHGRFRGEVSLANDGGFSSVVHALAAPVDVGGARAFRLRVKGDGSTYALRVKSAPGQRHAHGARFATTGAWQTVEVPFAEMTVAFRGRPVDVPNYAGEPVRELRLLIGNGRAERFALLIDWIGV